MYDETSTPENINSVYWIVNDLDNSWLEITDNNEVGTETLAKYKITYDTFMWPEYDGN